MRIAVYGTGGVGGYFGGRLAQAGEDVTFVARGDHLQALQAQGLRVESINGDFQVYPVQATDDPGQIGIVDLVIIGVKTWQIAEIAPALRPLIGPDTSVIPLQNGLEAPTQLTEALGADHVLGGLCAIYSYRSEPGCIRHVGLDPSITIGEMHTPRSGRTKELSTILQQAGINTTVAADIRIPMWEKFLILRWGIVGALTRAPAETLRSLPQTRQMIERACEEVINVATASGVSLPTDTVSRSTALLDSLPANATTSLQRDIMDGYPSELDAQAGVMVRLSQQTQTPAPLHEFLFHCLLPMEMKARGEL